MKKLLMLVVALAGATGGLASHERLTDSAGLSEAPRPTQALQTGEDSAVASPSRPGRGLSACLGKSWTDTENLVKRPPPYFPPSAKEASKWEPKMDRTWCGEGGPCSPQSPADLSIYRETLPLAQHNGATRECYRNRVPSWEPPASALPTETTTSGGKNAALSEEFVAVLRESRRYLEFHCAAIVDLCDRMITMLQDLEALR